MSTSINIEDHAEVEVAFSLKISSSKTNFWTIYDPGRSQSTQLQAYLCFFTDQWRYMAAFAPHSMQLVPQAQTRDGPTSRSRGLPQLQLGFMTWLVEDTSTGPAPPRESESLWDR